MFKKMNSVTSIISLIIIISDVTGTKQGDIVDISYDEQERRRTNASIECFKIMINQPNTRNGTHCPLVWDKILCWPDTKAGQTAVLPCPNYVAEFDTSANATKYCTEDGTWYYDIVYNQTWTNYTGCMGSPLPSLYESHMGRLRLMYNIGYGLSLVSLVLAVIIMLTFKRLHCARNTIHVNLFASFILRASISFMKENLLIQSVGFSFDVQILPNGRIKYIEESSHWQCKLFFTLFNYILGANYMWIFVEALYLCMLISVAVFSEKTGIKWYILFGWTAPITFVLPWAIVRAVVEDVFCWNTHPTPEYFWIMRAPIVTSIAINFIIFLYLIRVLFMKLNAVNSPEAKKFRYQKLAKSTLVLIPLFGVHYIVFIGLPDGLDERLELARLYFEMFFNSVQGFFVALLFCFLNHEVQTEIKKYWHRFKLTRLQNFTYRSRSHLSTLATYVTKMRGSISSFSNMEEVKDNQHLKGQCQIRDDEPSTLEKVEINKSYAKSGSLSKLNTDENVPMIPLTVGTNDICDTSRNGRL